VHALAMPVFYRAAHHDSCITVRGASYAPNAEADKNAAEKAIAEAHKIWAKRLPKDQKKLWDWIATSTDDLLSLLGAASSTICGMSAIAGSTQNESAFDRGDSVFLPAQRPSRRGELSGWAPAIRQTARQPFGPLFSEGYIGAITDGSNVGLAASNSNPANQSSRGAALDAVVTS